MAFQMNKLVLVMVALGSLMMMLQLIACSQVASAGNDGDKMHGRLWSAAAKPRDHHLEAGAGRELAPSQVQGVPVILVSQTRQANNKPDLFLAFLGPISGSIPGPINDFINQTIRPGTEQLTSTILTNVPGADEFYSQMSNVQGQLGNIGNINNIANLTSLFQSAFGR